MDGSERAALLLLGIGEQSATVVLKHMGHKHVQKIGLAMAKLENVSRDQVHDVLNDFVQIASDKKIQCC